MRILLVAIGLAVAACGTGHAPVSNSDGGDAGSPAQVACQAEVDARCMQLAMCEPGLLAAVFGDVATCESRSQGDCVTALNANGAGQTVAGAQTCTMAVGATCSEQLAGQTPPDCEPPIGQLATGTACAFDGQCQSQFCNVPIGSNCGTCAAQPTNGTPCSETGCGLSLICIPAGMMMMGTSAVCQTPVATGMTCGPMHPCDAGNSCVASGMMTGTCTPFATTVGATCSMDGHTAVECDRRLGLACDPMTTMCVQATFAAPGQTCGEVNGGLVGCSGSGDCQRALHAMTGICAAPAADGANCDSTLLTPCLQPARCVVTSGSTIGTCIAPDAASCM